MSTEPNKTLSGSKSARGEVPGSGYPDWPEWCKTFEERKAYQQGIADARCIAASKVAPNCGNELLKSIEGYLANKAEKGDELAAGLHGMLLEAIERPTYHLLTIDDSGVEIKDYESEQARLEAIVDHGNTSFSEAICIDKTGLEITDVFTAPDAESAAEELTDTAVISRHRG